MTTQLDPRLETFFTIENLRIGRGQETPKFEGDLQIKGRTIAQVSNLGRGGSNIYMWWGENKNDLSDKICALASKIASVKEPEFAELYKKSPRTALDSLIFDYVENEQLKQNDDLHHFISMENEGHMERRLNAGTFRSPPGAPTRQPLIQLPPVPPYVPPIMHQLRPGVEVTFGRNNGEKTLGRVLKVNNKSVLVEALESRGSKGSGIKWRVAPSLLTLA